MRRWFHRTPEPATVSPAPADNGEGLVRVGVRELIALQRGGASLALRPGSIRSRQSGGYLSPFKGRGMEFDEVRPYMTGDDVRTLDWRVTARTGRPHTKLFREERDRAVLLTLDLRRGMHFATRGAFKAVRAAQTAALLGWSAVQHGDRLGAMLFAEGYHHELRPRRGKPPMLHLLEQIADAPAWQPAPSPHQSSDALPEALTRLRRVAQPGSLLFVISDFLHLDDACEAHIAQLAQHNDLFLIFVHDPLEEALPAAGPLRVGDGSRTITLDSSAEAIRQRYHEAWTQRLETLRRLSRRGNISLLSLSTDNDPLPQLQQVLGIRR